MSTKAELCKETGIPGWKFEWLIEKGIIKGADRHQRKGSRGVAQYPADTSRKIWLIKDALGNNLDANEMVIELLLNGLQPYKQELLKPALITCHDRLLKYFFERIPSVEPEALQRRITRQVNQKMKGQPLEERKNIASMFSLIAGVPKPGTIDYALADAGIPVLRQVVDTASPSMISQAVRVANHFLAEHEIELETMCYREGGPLKLRKELLPGHFCKAPHSSLQVMRPLFIAIMLAPVPQNLEDYARTAGQWARQHNLQLSPIDRFLDETKGADRIQRIAALPAD